MNNPITQKGIAQAISDLNYRNQGSPKTRFVQVLKEFYLTHHTLDTPAEIDPDFLIKVIWETGEDPVAIRGRQKNLNSIRAAINADLMGLFENGRNPEGLVIGKSNRFEVSDAAREKVLMSFLDTAGRSGDMPLHRIAEALSVIGDFLADMTDLHKAEADEQIQRILDLVIQLSDQQGLPHTGEYRITRDCGSDQVKKKETGHENSRRPACQDLDHQMVLPIPSGEYRVGTPHPGRNELTGQQILLPAFHMEKFPVTNGQFEIFIEDTRYETTAERRGYGWVYSGRIQKTQDRESGLFKSVWRPSYSRKKIEGAFWYQPSGPGSTLFRKRHHPVVQVGLEDAMAYAAWAKKRLPSELEWEAAARTQNGYRFPWGERWQEGKCNIENSSFADTCPVDRYPEAENTYGLADLLGNVLEWTSDEWPSAPSGPSKNHYHIAKGGSWISDSNIRLYSRFSLERNFTSNTLGFRLMWDGQAGVT